MADLPDLQEALKALSSLLRCPVTGQQLHIATPEELRALTSHVGDGFLVREDQTGAYPVVNGIPSILPESLISVILNPIS